MGTALLLILLTPLVGAGAALVLGRRLGARTAWPVLLAPLVSCAAVGWLATLHTAGGREVVEWAWIPSLGLNLTFVVDGLALFFGFVVSGVGTLIVFYSGHYLDSHYRDHGAFYCYLMLFMGAMLGTVFAGNLLLLLVCWELTGVASFLLIGFLHEKQESRAGARMALLVTGGTGLAMLAGIVLLGQAAGTHDLAVLLDRGLPEGSPGLVGAAFVLIALGALGKSAQFPFHFWLPNAMAAPTPVSAYLHSATMVKLGVFLVARIFPIFRESELWEPLLITVCFGTMTLGALLALLAHDLKAILAYSTVSQLGFLIGCYGMASPAGAQVDLLHITNHVLYKGCLFMVAGIVDHATGTRDVRELGGLGRRLPLLAVIAAIGAATMAGLPGTLGFISKEYMLKEKFDYWQDGSWLHWYPLVLVVLASVLKVAFSLRLVVGVFAGPERSAWRDHFHAPGLGLLLPPLLLATGCVLFGLLPAALAAGLDQLRTPGLHHPEILSLSVWHGVSQEFVMSVLIVLAGAGLFALLQRARWRLSVPRLLRFDDAFEAAVGWLPQGAKLLGTALRFDRAFDYLGIVLGFAVALVGGFWWVHRAELWPGAPVAEDFDVLRSFVVALILVSVAMVVRLRRWTSQLIAMSIVGFLITFYFVLFRAPDLAMTQILVESATLLLALLLLARFPRSAELSEATRSFSRSRQAVNILVATGLGLLATGTALMGMRHKHVEPAGSHYLEQTLPLAHGSNAVNTILVDFRGFDTLLEITVLVIACLGALGLLMRYRRTPEEWAAGAVGPAGYGLGRSGKGEKKP